MHLKCLNQCILTTVQPVMNIWRLTSVTLLNLDQRLNEKIQKYQRNAIWYFLHSALKGYSTAQYKLGMILPTRPTRPITR